MGRSDPIAWGTCFLKRIRVLLLAVGCLAGFGCQSSDGPEPGNGAPETAQLIQEKVKASEELVEILKTVKDRASMKAVWSRLLKHYERDAELQKRFEKLPRPSPEALEQFHDQEVRLQAALNKQMVELQRIRRLAGGEEFLEQLDVIRQALAQSSGQGGGVP